VRLLMDSGAGEAGLGSIGATWELGYDAWPVRELRRRRSRRRGPGRSPARRPAQTGQASYTPDPRARRAQTLPGPGARRGRVEGPAAVRVAPGRAGKGLGLHRPSQLARRSSSPPVVLDVRLRATARDTDLQVTLSEVRPDGRETYVQNGWLRASHRRLDPRRSTAVDPVPTHLREDAAPLPRGRTTLVRVPVFPVAHAFRAGSRIRVTVTAPGGDRPRWDFATVDRGRTRVTVALGGARAVPARPPRPAGRDRPGDAAAGADRPARPAEPGVRGGGERRLGQRPRAA
jgi:hypothetical protein